MLSTKCSNSVLYFRAVESGLCRLLVDMLIVVSPGSPEAEVVVPVLTDAP